MSRNIFIEQLQRGDKEAMRVFVNENQHMIYRTCLAYLQNEHDAADLTQNVFLKAFEKLEQYKGDSKISTWLTRIAINLSINYLRDNKKRLEQVDIADINLPDESNNSEKTKQTKKAVRKAIFSLPEKQRKVFILHFYLELSYKDISEITGLSVSSLESLLFRSRKKLKVLLEKYYNETILSTSF
jgi:RNA polymerase sigma-70 factor, ECF subfamily